MYPDAYVYTFPWDIPGSKTGITWVNPQLQMMGWLCQFTSPPPIFEFSYCSVFLSTPAIVRLLSFFFFCWPWGYEVINYYDFNFHHRIPHEGESLSWLVKGDFILQGSHSNLLPSFQLSYLWFFLNWYKQCFDILNTSLLWMICAENISAMLFKLCSPSGMDVGAFGGGLCTAQL